MIGGGGRGVGSLGILTASSVVYRSFTQLQKKQTFKYFPYITTFYTVKSLSGTTRQQRSAS